MIEDTVNGFNSTVFAYGQTSSGISRPSNGSVFLFTNLSSGKTHTMYGSKGEEGVIDMAVNQLFYAMEETPNRKFLVTVSLKICFDSSNPTQCLFIVTQLTCVHSPYVPCFLQASFIEIYNESVIDLLADPSKTSPLGGLKIRENGEGDVFVENLKEKAVSCQDDIFT